MLSHDMLVCLRLSLTVATHPHSYQNTPSVCWMSSTRFFFLFPGPLLKICHPVEWKKQTNKNLSLSHGGLLRGPGCDEKCIPWRYKESVSTLCPVMAIYFCTRSAVMIIVTVQQTVSWYHPCETSLLIALLMCLSQSISSNVLCK